MGVGSWENRAIAHQIPFSLKLVLFFQAYNRDDMYGQKIPQDL